MDFSAATLIASLVVSTIGFGFFLYGKKQQRWPQLAAGLAMMIGPCFTGNAIATWVIGALSAAGVWLAVRLGW